MRISVLFLLIFLSCQQKYIYEVKVQQLKQAKELPYFVKLSGDSIFWEIIKERKSIIPTLISHIDDTVSTKAFVPNFGGNYTVGDACVMALQEIIEGFPTLALLGSDSLAIQEYGYGAYWQYVRENYENRTVLKEKARVWYIRNKHNLIWVEDKKLYPQSDDENSSLRIHPANGYYIVR
jgi:hypothetical protein